MNHDKRSAHIPRLTRVVAHGGNSGEGLALRGNAVLLEVEALQQQVEILFRVWGREGLRETFTDVRRKMYLSARLFGAGFATCTDTLQNLNKFILLQAWLI